MSCTNICVNEGIKIKKWILCFSFWQWKYREVWDKDKLSIHLPFNAPNFELSKANAINISNVSLDCYNICTSSNYVEILKTLHTYLKTILLIEMYYSFSTWFLMCKPYVMQSFWSYFLVLCRNCTQRHGMTRRPKAIISRRMLSLCLRPELPEISLVM